jgi:hypothetical protein
MIPFWCLMPKGEKLRPKQNGSANHLRIRIWFLSKYSYCKIWSLMGEFIDYGKKGEFLALDQFYS